MAVDYELAGDLKIGQVGIANLRIRSLDVPRLVEEMRGRVQRAPKLFARAAVVLDFGGLTQAPDVDTARQLIDGLRDAGVLPVALAYGTSEIERLSEQLGLPLLAKFRASYERAGDAEPVEAPAPKPRAKPEPARAEPAPTTPAQQAPTAPGLIHSTPVRSGQQVYAANRDLSVLANIGAGAEVMADGSIHIYGPLRGRALAGAQGWGQARIFCREFHAELVAIAGHYKVLEDIPKELRGKAVQIWLDGEELKIAALD
ncbi:septum site-determining protein MinC [Lysobacter terrestris]|uniref:Probable septum site-determining protein MinC n=1 Tax=Agrilutibacter terrestris TaxID=2865112 RepID=A0A7H0G1N1_9GAMM|nr:septum site-determining protein MinC [Lysobacter terrestris]